MFSFDIRFLWFSCEVHVPLYWLSLARPVPRRGTRLDRKVFSFLA